MISIKKYPIAKNGQNHLIDLAKSGFMPVPLYQFLGKDKKQVGFTEENWCKLITLCGDYIPIPLEFQPGPQINTNKLPFLKRPNKVCIRCLKVLYKEDIEYKNE